MNKIRLGSVVFGNFLVSEQLFCGSIVHESAWFVCGGFQKCSSFSLRSLLNNNNIQTSYNLHGHFAQIISQFSFHIYLLSNQINQYISPVSKFISD